MSDPPSPQRGAFIASLGAWMQVALPLGLISFMFGVVEGFEVIKTSGAGDPARLSAVVDDILTYLEIAVIVSLIGLILVTLAVTAFSYRSRGMYKFLWGYGLLILSLSLGLWILGFKHLVWHLPFALFFVILGRVKKEEFMNAVPPKRPLPSCYNLDP